MQTTPPFIPHATAPNGDLYAEVSRSSKTPPEGGVGAGLYATLNDHLERPPENVYGMASASSRMDLTLALGGRQHPVPRTPPPDYEEVGAWTPGPRTPSPDYEQVDPPASTHCFGQPPANHPLPPRPAASPDLDPIYSTSESPGPVLDKTPPPPPAKPSKPGVYFELEPQVRTGKTPPPLPAKPSKPGVYFELEPQVQTKTPPPPPPQHLKPGRTPAAAGSPVAVGGDMKTRFQSVNSELAALLANRRIE